MIRLLYIIYFAGYKINILAYVRSNVFNTDFNRISYNRKKKRTLKYEIRYPKDGFLFRAKPLKLFKFLEL